MKADEELLKLQVDELCRFYDNICSGFNHTREKALALLAGEVAIVAFLFASNGSDKPLIPNIVFAAVFVGVGVTCLAIAFMLFLIVLAPMQWQHPPETKRLLDQNDNINKDIKSYLTYLKSEYTHTLRWCIIKVSSRSKKLTWGLYLLSIGIVILILIKYGGGSINL